MNISGSKILVTGGSSGLGKATAAMLIASGAKVAISGRNKEKLEKVATEIGAIPIHFDVSNYTNLQQAVNETLDKLGGIDTLINNAGFGKFALLEDTTIDMFEDVFATNVFGLAMLTKEVAKHFITQQHGNIVNIASTAGRKGFAYGSVYAASKFALSGLTECWRAELRKHNIRVIQVNPSAVPTAFNVEDRTEKPIEDDKLTPTEIAHTIKACLEMDKRGFIPEVSVWATNPK